MGHSTGKHSEGPGVSPDLSLGSGPTQVISGCWGVHPPLHPLSPHITSGCWGLVYLPLSRKMELSLSPSSSTVSWGEPCKESAWNPGQEHHHKGSTTTCSAPQIRYRGPSAQTSPQGGNNDTWRAQGDKWVDELGSLPTLPQHHT